MDLLRFSETNNFLPALKGFFEDLKVPVNYVSDLPATAKEILINSYKETETFKAINDVYFLGIVDDAAFDEQKSIDAKQIKSDYDGILIFGVELQQRNKDLLPTRSQLADIARAFNREFYYTPVVVVFKYGNHIAFANTERIQYKQEWREGEKVGKVTLLRDIDLKNVHEGHRRILKNLEISRNGKSAINDFNSLYKYWQEVLSVSILNKVFYKELSNWYFWAIKEVRFPNEPLQLDFDSLDKYDEAIKEHNGKNVIRLLTRLLFIWFIKEKGLIPEEIFDEKEIANRFIDGFTPQKPEGMFLSGKNSSKYYRAILQNLFFATLNQPRGDREFRGEGKHLNATQLMRYQSYLKEPDYFIELMESKVPFMNGGLFECLDKPHPTLKGAQGGDRIIYVDGFSDRTDNELLVPDFLFFDTDELVDLSKDYGNSKAKNEKTRGLFNILKSYKFTITENTPIDEDVALDPELLGKVFENLLASYNPETKTTARKQTGSFYTPREIVNYMVEESLIAYLKNQLISISVESEEELNNHLHELVSFSPNNPFEGNSSTQKQIIKALDTCKILDPACGSGAYPMGILQKMAHILHKIDPNNTEWKQRQIDRVNEAIESLELVDDAEYKNKAIKELKAQIKDIEAAFENNELDYGRKLFLIENCIYGVDIQPIATQISKLRFFISLVVDQKVDASKENFGIRPLPNLETKFVAANTLIGLPNGIQGSLFDKREVKKLEDELKKVRHKLFSVKTPSIKRELRAKDKALREEMQVALAEQLGNETAQLLAQWDPYDQNTSSPFFDKEWMFDITEGFDVVIGNPPYVQCPKGIFSEELFPYSEGKDKGKQNLYKVFVENSYNLLKEKGVASMIVQSSLMCDISSQFTRELLLTKTKINHIIEFPKKAKTKEGQVFENVLQGTCVYNFIKKTPDKNTTFNVSIENDVTTVNQIEFEKLNQFDLMKIYPNGYFIPLINKNEYKLISKVSNKAKILREFYIESKKGDLSSDNDKKYFKNIENGHSLIRGNNVQRYSLKKPFDKVLIDEKTNKIIKKNNNYFIIVFQNITGTTDKYRIHCNLIDKNQNFVFLDTTIKIYLNVENQLNSILSQLNSKLIDWYFRKTSTNNHVNGYEIEQLPIIIPTNQEPFIKLVEKISSGKENGEDTTIFEHQIDVMVYHLYDLTYEEACVIDHGLSKEDFELYKIK
jgi:tRNA1(Val) A37 N6-methylase TrmN6